MTNPAHDNAYTQAAILDVLAANFKGTQAERHAWVDSNPGPFHLEIAIVLDAGKNKTVAEFLRIASAETIWANLEVLARKGLVTSTGKGGNIRWRRTEDLVGRDVRDLWDAKDKEIADLKNQLTPYVLFEEEARSRGYNDLMHYIDCLERT